MPARAVVPRPAARRGGRAADADIDARIAARLAARKAQNWAESDRIRDELAAAGVILEDKPGGHDQLAARLMAALIFDHWDGRARV